MTDTDLEALTAKIEKCIDEEINPVLEEHGGWIELSEVFPEERAISVRFRGQCAGCHAVDGTLEETVIPKIRHSVREIRHVEIDDDLADDVWEMAKSLFTHNQVD